MIRAQQNGKNKCVTKKIIPYLFDCHILWMEERTGERTHRFHSICVFNDKKGQLFEILLSVSRFFVNCFFFSTAVAATAAVVLFILFFSHLTYTRASFWFFVFVSTAQIQFLPFHIIMQILIWLCCKFSRPPNVHTHTNTSILSAALGIVVEILSTLFRNLCAHNFKTHRHPGKGRAMALCVFVKALTIAPAHFEFA